MDKKEKYSPEAKERNRQYILAYLKENSIPVNIRMNKKTEAEYIEIYKSIPNKSKWFKECLLEYKNSH
jgi:hypothetical protein